MRWLHAWQRDVEALRRLQGGRSRPFDIAIDAAVLLVILVDVLAIAALVTGAGQ